MPGAPLSMHHGRIPPAAIGLLAGLLTTAVAVALTATGLLPPWLSTPLVLLAGGLAAGLAAPVRPTTGRPARRGGRRLRRGPALDRALRPVAPRAGPVLLALSDRADRRGLRHALRPSERDRRRRRRGRPAPPRCSHCRRGTGPGPDARAAAVARDRRGRPPHHRRVPGLGPGGAEQPLRRLPGLGIRGRIRRGHPLGRWGAGGGRIGPPLRRLRPRGPRALLHGAGLDGDGGRRARGALADCHRAHGGRGPPGRRARRGARRQFPEAGRTAQCARRSRPRRGRSARRANRGDPVSRRTARHFRGAAPSTYPLVSNTPLHGRQQERGEPAVAAWPSAWT